MVNHSCHGLDLTLMTDTKVLKFLALCLIFFRPLLVSLKGPSNFFLLFSELINSVHHVLYHCHIHYFADDIKHYLQVHSTDDFSRVQADLDCFSDWFSILGLSLNLSKYKALTFTRTRSTCVFTYYLLKNYFVHLNALFWNMESLFGIHIRLMDQGSLNVFNVGSYNGQALYLKFLMSHMIIHQFLAERRYTAGIRFLTALLNNKDNSLILISLLCFQVPPSFFRSIVSFYVSNATTNYLANESFGNYILSANSDEVHSKIILSFQFFL